MYAALFDFRAPCSQTKILIFQGTLKLGDLKFVSSCIFITQTDPIKTVRN